MADSWKSHPRGRSPIRLPIDKDRYQQIVSGPEAFRRFLGECFTAHPELFPEGLRVRFPLQGLPPLGQDGHPHSTNRVQGRRLGLLHPTVLCPALVRYLVQEQDVVTAGQLLAEIDPVPYREQVALLQARLTVAEAQFAAAQTSLELSQAQIPREIEVAQRALAAAKAELVRDEKTLQFTETDVEKGIHEARSDLEAARARLDLAEKDQTRYATLFAREAATQRQSQEATRTYQTTQAEVTASEARLGRALAAEKKVEATRQAVVAAVQQVQKAEQSLALTRTRKLEITQAERQLEIKKQQVGEARRALEVAKTSLRYTQLVAPFPGVVVHLYRHLGDHVPAGTPVLSLYNPELTYVTANLEETKLEGVAPGNAVRLDIDAFSQPFRGRGQLCAGAAEHLIRRGDPGRAARAGADPHREGRELAPAACWAVGNGDDRARAGRPRVGETGRRRHAGPGSNRQAERRVIPCPRQPLRHASRRVVSSRAPSRPSGCPVSFTGGPLTTLARAEGDCQGPSPS